MLLARLVTMCFGIAGLHALFGAESRGQSCLERVPDEQAVELRTARYVYPSPPGAYHAGLGWANVVIGKLEYGSQGKVTVQRMELWEVTGGIRRLVTDRMYCPGCSLTQDRVFGFLVPKSQWMDRGAWDKSNQGEEFSVTAEGFAIPERARPLTRMIARAFDAYDQTKALHSAAI